MKRSACFGAQKSDQTDREGTLLHAMLVTQWTRGIHIYTAVYAQQERTNRAHHKERMYYCPAAARELPAASWRARRLDGSSCVVAEALFFLLCWRRDRFEWPLQLRSRNVYNNGSRALTTKASVA